VAAHQRPDIMLCNTQGHRRKTGNTTFGIVELRPAKIRGRPTSWSTRKEQKSKTYSVQICVHNIRTRPNWTRPDGLEV
jgi:hypothetical protein